MRGEGGGARRRGEGGRGEGGMQRVYKARTNLSKSTLKTKPLIHPFTDKQP